MSSTTKPEESSLSIDAMALPAFQPIRGDNPTADEDQASDAIENMETASHQLSTQDAVTSSNATSTIAISQACVSPSNGHGGDSSTDSILITHVSKRTHSDWTGGIDQSPNGRDDARPINMPDTQLIRDDDPAPIEGHASTGTISAFQQLSTQAAEISLTGTTTTDLSQPSGAPNVFSCIERKFIDANAFDKPRSNSTGDIPPPLSGRAEAHPTNTPNVPPPPVGWGFNLFLNEIAEELECADIEALKFVCKACIVKKNLTMVNNARALFTLLQESGFLSADNLIYLQRILFAIGRKDLIRKGIEYANNDRRSVVCYPASDTPANGYKYVTWHIQGWNFQDCTPRDIQEFRSRVADILCAPPEFVLIAGIEPSNSMIVTLMIPDLHVELLVEMLRKNETFPEFVQQGIDSIQINKELFYLTVSGNETIERTDQPEKLVELYEQLLHTKKQVDMAEEIRVRLEVDSKSAKNVSDLLTSTFQPRNLRPMIMAHLENMKSCFALMQNERIEIVLELMKSYYDILTYKYLEHSPMYFRSSLRATLLELSDSVASLEDTVMDVPDIQLRFDQHLRKKEQRSVTKVPVTASQKECLRSISEALNTEDIDKLQQEYAVNTRHLAGDKGGILEDIYNITIAGSHPKPYVQFVIDLLLKLGRSDLVEVFQQKYIHLSERELWSEPFLDILTMLCGRIRNVHGELQFLLHQRLSPRPPLPPWPHKSPMSTFRSLLKTTPSVEVEQHTAEENPIHEA